MKKLLTLLLALTLSLSLATAALADDGNSRVRQFDPTITVTKNGGTTIVTLVATEDNNAIFAERQPTVTARA